MPKPDSTSGGYSGAIDQRVSQQNSGVPLHLDHAVFLN